MLGSDARFKLIGPACVVILLTVPNCRPDVTMMGVMGVSGAMGVRGVCGCIEEPALTVTRLVAMSVMIDIDMLANVIGFAVKKLHNYLY